MAINFNELQKLLNRATAAAENEKDIRKGLSRIETLLGNIHKEVANVYALLDGATPAKRERSTRAPRPAVEPDADAPYGRKKDGTPRAKAGRSKTASAA
ncbi:MAG TPA: hypothetical protein VF629_07000 [Hymenobacter sp.]|jgi:DNA-binding protein H-NS|uniref:hypothetical protein n=1 Tax=Hymenobacter sp. TaxID=1898978 RepID=UPI002EDA79DE